MINFLERVKEAQIRTSSMDVTPRHRRGPTVKNTPFLSHVGVLLLRSCLSRGHTSKTFTMSVLSHNKARPGVNQFLSFVFVKFSIPETEQSDVTSWVPLLQRSKFKYPLNHMYPTSKRLEAPALCSSQEAPLPASVGKWPLPTCPMLFFYKQRCTLSLLQ